MDFHAFDRRGGAHVMTTDRGKNDETPLQLISADRLAYYRQMEEGLRALAALVDPLPHVADSPGPDGSSDCNTQG